MLECEIKIPVADLTALRRRLADAGGRRLAASKLERNQLFDTADGSLAGAGRVLRLRQVGGHNLVTAKGPALLDGAVKRRHEVELEVASAEGLIELLGALGFVPSVRYEKRRERWRLSNVEVDLDHTPMGDFVELEGPAEALEDAARRLGLDAGSAVAESYIELWQAHRRDRPGLGPDMVFE